MSVSEAVEMVATDGATTLAFQHVYHSSTQHTPAYGPLSPPLSAPPPCLIVPPYPPPPPHHPSYPPPVPMCSQSCSPSMSSPLVLSCSPRTACPSSSPPCHPHNSTCGPLSPLVPHSTPVAASPYFGLDRDMTSPSLHNPTPSLHSTTPSLHSTTPSLHSMTRSLHSTNTPSLHSTTQSLHSTTPSLHSTTSSLHSTTPAQSSLASPQPSASPSLSNPGVSLLTFAQPCPSPAPLSPVIPCMCQGDPTCPTTTGYCDTSYPCVIYTVMPSYPMMPLYNQEEEEGDEGNLECKNNVIDQTVYLSPKSDVMDQTVYLSPMPLHHSPPQANIEEITECDDKKMSHTEDDGELDDDERELEDEMKVLSLSAGQMISPRTGQIISPRAGQIISPRAGPIIASQPSDRMGLFGSDGCWYPVQHHSAPLQQAESILSSHTIQEFTGMSCDATERCPQLNAMSCNATERYSQLPAMSCDVTERYPQLHSPDQSFTNTPPNPRNYPNQPMPLNTPRPGKSDVMPFSSVRPRGLPRLSLPFHRSSEWLPDFTPPYPRAPDWLPHSAPPFYKPKSVMLGGPRRFPMFPEHDMFPRPNLMMPGNTRGPWPSPMMVRARQISLMPFYNYFHDLDLPVNTLGRPRLLHSHPCKGHLSVEEVWVRHMGALFRNLPHPWLLTAAPRGKQPMGTSWSTFKDLAKVRFYCKVCSDGWTSMYGVVVFHYRQDKVNGSGTVLYQVAGQKCRLCQPTVAQEFQLPLWYPEEAQKVITNLYYNIASTLYGLVTPKYIRTRRLGMPLTHHNQLLCQGCSQGVCKLDKGGEGNQEGGGEEEETIHQQQQ